MDDLGKNFEAYKTVRTTCPYCGVGCGVLATPQPDGSVDIKGDPEHPANFGRLCSKGSALGETIDLDGRLLEPKINGETSSWEAALDLVADKFQSAIKEHGPDSVAFYVSGQILTEDYYIANKLMKGFIGSANIDTNSRLCMASSVAGHKRAFGSDTVPGLYEDLELADLIVLVGSNLAWCHPVIFQRVQAAKAERPEIKIVLIDPRETMTAELADLHLPIKADGDTPLFSGLLNHLVSNGVVNDAFVSSHTEGFENALEEASKLSINDVSELSGLNLDKIKEFYDLVANTEKTVTVYSQGVNQSSCGTDKVNSIINTHLATGRIGKPGMGPFSVTGQPNAMGGREVGGLANMLACHMDIENPDHRNLVQTFWQSPTIADKQGLKAVDMFNAVHDGRIKAIWIMSTNPVDSMPNADFVAEALEKCPFVVVSEALEKTDTAQLADVLLPSAIWGEKEGSVTNSERRISRQRNFLDVPGNTKPDWWQFMEVAKRMGFEQQFDYNSAVDIFREYAQLSELDNNGKRDFDIGLHSDISSSEYITMKPFLWPAIKGSSQTNTRFFANGNFYTPSKKARFIPTAPKVLNRVTDDYPVLLNTGRIRDHWHTMTRTGKSQRLSQHLAEPFVEINPKDAKTYGVNDDDLVSVTSSNGEIVIRAIITDRQKSGAVFVPMHWTDQFASSARVDTLVDANCDPISGQPALKSSTISIKTASFKHHGFAICRSLPNDLKADYWSIAKCAEGWRVEFAFLEDDLERQLSALLNLQTSKADIHYDDKVSGQKRLAWFDGAQLNAVVYIAQAPISLSRVWAAEQLLVSYDEPHKRIAVAAGRPAADQPDRGPIVCSCFSVGANEIIAAARDGESSVEAIGKCLNAGTNCGSCKSEIASLLKDVEDETPILAAE